MLIRINVRKPEDCTLISINIECEKYHTGLCTSQNLLFFVMLNLTAVRLFYYVRACKRICTSQVYNPHAIVQSYTICVRVYICIYAEIKYFIFYTLSFILSSSFLPTANIFSFCICLQISILFYKPRLIVT